MANSFRLGVALGFVVFLLVSLYQLVWAQDIMVNVSGTADSGIKATVDFPSYKLEVRSIDSQVTFGSSVLYSQSEEGNVLSASTNYDMQGWWNRLGERVGIREVTANSYKGIASGVSFTGRAIVGQGLASAGAGLFEHQHQAQGIGVAEAGMAFLNVERDEGGNVTVSQGQAQYGLGYDGYDNAWQLDYSIAIMAPIGAEEDLDWFDEWASICQGVATWDMTQYKGGVK